MSDLGAIFHVKKDGIQYDAHAYTTLDECPEPNLKLTYKGQQAYVKLEAKGSGDVPCYVKPKSRNTVYQVKKQAVPTGSKEITYKAQTNFTVPAGIKVIRVEATHSYSTVYVGVTPNTTFTLGWKRYNLNDPRALYNISSYVIWQKGYENKNAILSWSPEINKQTPTITDY